MIADDEEVRRRQKHGLTRLTIQGGELLLHPGGGGPQGYPCWVRDIEIARVQGGLEPMVTSRRSTGGGHKDFNHTEWQATEVKEY